MKIKFVIAAALMLSMSAYAQKDEIKAIKKIDAKFERLEKEPTEADMQDYKNAIDAAETKIAFATKEQQIEIYFYKGKYYLSQLSQEALTNPTASSDIYYNMKSSFDQVIELEKGGKDKYSKLIVDELYSRVKAAITILADKLVEGNELALASQYYYTAYGLDETDHYTLYKAAAYAVNAKDYKKALDYYVELDKTGWTGEGTTFTARNKTTGKVEGFPNKASRDAALLATHDTPAEQKIESVKGEIVRNIALLYIELGQEAKAKEVMADARKLNPDDVGLIVSEANIYINAKDFEGAKKLIGEAIQKQPNNADLFYALGSLSAATDAKAAEGYYKKATEIDPNNFEAYARLGDLVLQDEQKLTDEMNGLGNTAADNKRYAELKKQKDANYKAAVGYYEKAYNIKKDDQYVIGMLASLYQALEMEAKYQEFKAKKQ
jgi:Tfp pilus assembly protein PilF